MILNVAMITGRIDVIRTALSHLKELGISSQRLVNSWKDIRKKRIHEQSESKRILELLFMTRMK